MFEFHYTIQLEPRKAIEEIKKKISGFKPNLAIFFLAGNLCKNPELFKLDCNTISVPVEGIITPKGVWSGGALVLATDSEVSVRILGGKASEVREKLQKVKKEEFNFLIYPLIFIKSNLTVIKTLLKLRRDLNRASKAFEDIIYPMNTILRPFRDLGKKAVAMNIFPLKIGIGIPKIAFNGRNIDRKVLCISFKEDIKCDFSETFPERGKSFEETKEILSQELLNAKKVSVFKKGLAIKEIDGMSVKDFLRMQKVFMRKDLENDIVRDRFFGATPYVMCFISKETFGSSFLGLMDYDLRFYPSLFELDKFFDEAIFAGEFVRGGVKSLIEKVREADFAIIDQNFMLMFEERVVEVFKNIGGHGVLTSFPSFTGNLRRNFMSEIERGICVNGTETMVFLNFK
ncbi:MAG: hypothetical protein RMH75_03930 [Archaeoglobaceae archaeon]|nr:hypothetical protein [Archaeoglobaceae archaeon]